MADAAAATFRWGEHRMTVTLAPCEKWRWRFLRHIPYFVGRPPRFRATFSNPGIADIPVELNLGVVTFVMVSGPQRDQRAVVDTMGLPIGLTAGGSETFDLEAKGMLAGAGQANIVSEVPRQPAQDVYVLWGVMPESYLVPAVVSLLVGLGIVALNFLLRPSIVINLPPTP